MQSEINRQDRKEPKTELSPLRTSDLTKGVQSTAVCKCQRTAELQKAQGYVGLFLGPSTSHSGLRSALNEGDLFPHRL